MYGGREMAKLVYYICDCWSCGHVVLSRNMNAECPNCKHLIRTQDVRWGRIEADAVINP